MHEFVNAAWRIAKRRNDLEALVEIEQTAARLAREKAQFQKQRADALQARVVVLENAVAAYQAFRAWYYSADAEALVREIEERRAALDRLIDAAMVPSSALTCTGARLFNSLLDTREAQCAECGAWVLAPDWERTGPLPPHPRRS